MSTTRLQMIHGLIVGLLLGLLLFCRVAHGQCPGDANSDGRLTITDIVATVNAVLEGTGQCHAEPLPLLRCGMTPYLLSGTMNGEPVTGDLWLSEGTLSGPNLVLWSVPQFYLTNRDGTLRITGAGALWLVTIEQRLTLTIAAQVNGALVTLTGSAPAYSCDDSTYRPPLRLSGGNVVVELGPLQKAEGSGEN